METILEKVIKARQEYMILTGHFPVQIIISKRLEDEFNDCVRQYITRLSLPEECADTKTLMGMEVEFKDIYHLHDFVFTPLNTAIKTF